MKDEEKTASSNRPLPFVLCPFVWSWDSGQSRRTFILPPSSFILCFSVSAQKSMNIWIFGSAQRLISAAEDNLSVADHQDLAVNQAKFLAFFLKDDFARFIDHSVFRR